MSDADPIPNPQFVRKATPEDAGRLIPSATSILLEGCIQPVSEGRVANMVACCVNGEGAIAGIIDGRSGIEASIGLAIESYDYSDAQHLQVKWLGVHAAFRTKNHGMRLIEFAKWASDSLEMPVFGDLLTTKYLEAKLHVYARLMPQVGALFCWGLRPKGAFEQHHIGHDPYGDRHQRKKPEWQADWQMAQRVA